MVNPHFMDEYIETQLSDLPEADESLRMLTGEDKNKQAQMGSESMPWGKGNDRVDREDI